MELNNPKCLGDLVQIDSIVISLNGVKMFLISGIDVVSRFGFSYSFPRLSTRSARKFMKKLLKVSSSTFIQRDRKRAAM
ncbi:hypothetical protein H5T88_05935 [bacterium]|nr:hypothetical protein [bacterium]